MNAMTISQALRSIKRTRGKIAELSERAASCVSFDEAKPPVWDFAMVREELAQAKDNLLVEEKHFSLSEWESRNAAVAPPVDDAEVL